MIFLDIETVPEFRDLKNANDEYINHFVKFATARGLLPIDSNINFIKKAYNNKAGLYPEFGRIVCISVCYRGTDKMEIKSFTGVEGEEIMWEHQLLKDFYEFVCIGFNNIYPICGHNAKAFDFPFIASRCMRHRISTPPQFRTIYKKPWELVLFDTVELYSQSRYKYNISLDLLCYHLGIESPKKDISGADVADLYYSGKIDIIKDYCEDDVLATAKVWRVLRDHLS